MSRIQWVQDNVLTKEGITFPEYLYNFNTEESCDSNAAMCCWVADSTDAGDGTCTDTAGCQDGEPMDNTDICLVDIENSPLASHTASGIAVYIDESEGAANCMGFTWSDGNLSDLYKGNLLFEVAMRYGLKDNGYTRSVPHAPMCACIEQMPVVSKADCKDVEATDSWSFSPNPENSLLRIWHSHVDLIFNDCGGADLATNYLATHSKSIAHRITGECTIPEASFLLTRTSFFKSLNGSKLLAREDSLNPKTPAIRNSFWAVLIPPCLVLILKRYGLNPIKSYFVDANI